MSPIVITLTAVVVSTLTVSFDDLPPGHLVTVVADLDGGPPVVTVKPLPADDTPPEVADGQ